MEQIAELLAETLEGPCWAAFANLKRCGGENIEAVPCALRLFRLTRPHSRKQLMPVAPEDYAIAMISEVASGYAMLGKPWTAEEAHELPLPTRSVLEELIRTFGVDEWAAGLGYPLTFDDHSGRDHTVVLAEESIAPTATDEDQRRAAAAFAESAAAYGTFLKLTRSDQGRQFLQERFRGPSCGQVAFLRKWAIWIRDTLDEDLLPLVLAMIYIARGSFVLAWDSESQHQIFPTQVALQELVLREPVIAWLSECGLEIPGWLL
jgi:hypothetical protein